MFWVRALGRLKFALLLLGAKGSGSIELDGKRVLCLCLCRSVMLSPNTSHGVFLDGSQTLTVLEGCWKCLRCRCF